MNYGKVYYRLSVNCLHLCIYNHQLLFFYIHSFSYHVVCVACVRAQVCVHMCACMCGCVVICYMSQNRLFCTLWLHNQLHMHIIIIHGITTSSALMSGVLLTQPSGLKPTNRRSPSQLFAHGHRTPPEGNMSFHRTSQNAANRQSNSPDSVVDNQPGYEPIQWNGNGSEVRKQHACHIWLGLLINYSLCMKFTYSVNHIYYDHKYTMA